MMRRIGLALVVLFIAACSGEVTPAAVTSSDVCANCRMTILNPQFAAQVIAPGEEAKFFDDIGCLAAALTSGKATADGVAFVTDHRTREWIRAQDAVFTRVPGIATPMGSHVVAHKDADSRTRDSAARAGTVIPVAEAIPALAAAARHD